MSSSKFKPPIERSLACAVLEAMAPGATEDLALYGPVEFYEFDAADPAFSVLGIASSARSWAQSPEDGIIRARMKTEAAPWFSSFVDQSISQVTVGTSTLVTTAAGGELVGLSRSSVMRLSPAEVFARIQTHLNGQAGLKALVQASSLKLLRATPGYSAPTSGVGCMGITPDAQGRAALAAFCESLGERYLATEPVLILLSSSPPGQNTGGYGVDANGSTPVLNGAEYVTISGPSWDMNDMFNIFIKDLPVPKGVRAPDGTVDAAVDRVFPRDFPTFSPTNVDGNGKTTLKTYEELGLRIPVAPSATHEHLFFRVDNGGPPVWRPERMTVAYQKDPRYLDYTSVSGSLRKVFFPGDDIFFGTVARPASLPARPNPQWISWTQLLSYGRAADVACLPFAGLPSVTSYLEARNAVTTVTELLPSDADLGTHPVTLRRVRGTAGTALWAMPGNWIDTYLLTGFGLYDGLKGTTLEASMAKSEDIRGLPIRIAMASGPLPIPSDLVMRTEVYKSYARARSKACKTNDFMRREFVPGVKWQAVHDHFLSLPQIRALLSVGELSSTPPLVLPVDGQYSGVTLTVTGGVVAVGGAQHQLPADVDAGDPQDIADLVLGGAVCSPNEAAVLAAVAGSAAMLADLRKEKAAFKATARAGSATGTEAYSFAWEDVGVDGFPTYWSLPADAAYRAAIVSEFSYPKAAARLVEVFKTMTPQKVLQRFGASKS